MPRIVYDGPAGHVEFYGDRRVRGEPFDVPDAIADAAVGASAFWHVVAEPAPKTKTSKKSKQATAATDGGAE